MSSLSAGFPEIVRTPADAFDTKKSSRRPKSHLPLKAPSYDPYAPVLATPATPASFRSDSQLAHTFPMSPQPAGNLASFPEEPFHFGFHVQAPMTESDPFVLRSPRTVATPANTSFPASFKWTVPTNPREESHILDRSGNPVYTIRSPSRRKTTISDEYGDVVAKMKWPGRPFMTAPTVRLNRDIPMRIKDWIRFCPSMHCRSILLRGDTYYLTETGEGSTQIFKNGHEDDDRVGIITVGHGGVSLDIIPTLLVLLEEFVIIATILSVSQNSNMRIWGSKLGELGDVRIVHRGDN